MIRAWLPERVATLHTLPADERVLQCHGQRMPHMERAGDVGRRDHDGERRGLAVRIGSEPSLSFPGFVELGFGVVRLKRFAEHRL